MRKLPMAAAAVYVLGAIIPARAANLPVPYTGSFLPSGEIWITSAAGVRAPGDSSGAVLRPASFEGYFGETIVIRNKDNRQHKFEASENVCAVDGNCGLTLEPAGVRDASGNPRDYGMITLKTPSNTCGSHESIAGSCQSTWELDGVASGALMIEDKGTHDQKAHVWHAATGQPYPSLLFLPGSAGFAPHTLEVAPRDTIVLNNLDTITHTFKTSIEICASSSGTGKQVCNVTVPRQSSVPVMLAAPESTSPAQYDFWCQECAGGTTVKAKLIVSPAWTWNGSTLPVSTTLAGTPGNRTSGGLFPPAVSGDGRYVAFTSEASDLIPSDANGTVADVFVRDLASATTTLVSLTDARIQANNVSQSPSISADGRYIAFESLADNLDSQREDANQTSDIFVHDRVTQTTVRVSVAENGAEADDASAHPSISGDGRYVTFSSWATNLSGADGDFVSDVFVHDRDVDGDGFFDEPGAIRTTLLSVGIGGLAADGNSFASVVSLDGGWVAFESDATNLVTSDTNGSTRDIFVSPRSGGAPTLVSLDSSGVQSNGSSRHASISDAVTGFLVAFDTTATNLDSNDTDASEDVYLRDVVGMTTMRASAPIGGGATTEPSLYPSISADGSFVSFASQADNLVAGDTNGFPDIFLFEIGAGKSLRVSITSQGDQAVGGPSLFSALSNDGRAVAFSSDATNLAGGDTTGFRDVFAHLLEAPCASQCRVPVFVRAS